MKKSIYHHIADTYKDTIPTLEQVTEIVKEHAPSIYSPNQTFDEIVSYIHNNYTWYFKNTERN